MRDNISNEVFWIAEFVISGDVIQARLDRPSLVYGEEIVAKRVSGESIALATKLGVLKLERCRD